MRFIKLMLCCLLAVTLLAGDWIGDSRAAAEQVNKENEQLLDNYFSAFIQNPMPTLNKIRYSIQDSQWGLLKFLAIPIQIAYRTATWMGAEIAKPLGLMERSGITIIRAAYGEMNIVLRRSEMPEQVRNFASVALKVYDRGEQPQAGDAFEAEKHLLKNGKFHYDLFREQYEKRSEAEQNNIQYSAPTQLYKQYLLEDRSLLLNKQEQKQFAYILLFYDQSGQPLGYIAEDLPLINHKMVTKPTIVALVYHHFSTKSEEINGITVHPDEFRKQLKMLRENDYVPIRQQDLLAYMEGGEEVRLPLKSVLITIDDGYESNYEYAFPALVDEQFYATIFSITSYIDRDTHNLSMLTWEQSNEMVQSSFVDIQSHTHASHYEGTTDSGTKGAAAVTPLLIDGKQETQSEYKDRIRTDLLEAKSEIEGRLHNKVISLAYPYGSFNDDLIELLHDTGHKVMYTVEEGVIRKGMDLDRLPRINVAGPYHTKRLLRIIRKFS